MAELLDDLIEKKNQAFAEAEKHKRKRDELNEKTKEWAQRRDELNAQVRELVDQASKHRQERDRFNEEVRKAKEERETWNRRVADLTDELNRLKRRKLPRGVVPLERLKRDARALEFKQQTSVLTVEKERELIEQIAKLQNEVRRREKELEEDEEIRNVLLELRKTKETAESFHKKVGELAEKAQVEHDTMVSLYEMGDQLRGEADAAQEEFIKTKMLADEEHRKHIEFIRQVHDYDKIIQGMRVKQKRVRFEKEEVSVKKEAEIIFERFKKGEKLSTEDLMTLQKSGYL